MKNSSIKKKIIKEKLFTDVSNDLNSERIIVDPNGSYTGVPIDPLEKPVQDVDDL